MNLTAIVLGEIVLICWVLAVFAWYRTKSLQRRSEERLRVLERFSSTEELTAFLETKAGQRIMPGLDPRSINPLAKIITACATGIALVVIGGGFFLLLGRLPGTESLARELPSPFLIVAFFVAILGVGVVVAAFVSYLLSQRLGDGGEKGGLD